MIEHLSTAERGYGSYRILAVLRWVMVLIFLPFGRHKFEPRFEHGIVLFISNSPFVSWLSVLGVSGQAHLIGIMELTIALLLILGAFSPACSAFGAFMGMCTFLLTFSFLFTTPGAATWSWSSDPLIMDTRGQFLYLNGALFCICLVLFRASLPANLKLEHRDARG